MQRGIEIQVASAAPDRPLRKGSIGGIYDLVEPKVYALKPDDWNRYTITCEGSKIKVILNGQEVSDADLSQWTEVGKNPDGSTNKFDRALKDYERTGYIGLQDHGTPVWYRNIRIKPIRSSR